MTARALIYSILVVAITSFGIRIYGFSKSVRGGFDEKAYHQYATTLAHEGLDGYRTLMREFSQNADLQNGPPPTRIAYVALSSLPCWLANDCGLIPMAEISLYTGVALCILATILFLFWFPLDMAIAATALVVCSPLGISLSVLALQDALFSLIVLGFVAACAMFLEKPSHKKLFAIAALAAFGILVKETMVFVMFAQIMVAFLARKRRFDKVFFQMFSACFVGGLIATAVVGVVVGDMALLSKLISSHTHSPEAIVYASSYLKGPWYRYFIDLALVSPLIVICALFALPAMTKSSAKQFDRVLCWTAVAFMVTFSCLPLYNLRFIAFADIFLRVMAVWGVMYLIQLCGHAQEKTRRVVFCVAIVMMCAFDLCNYHKIYIQGKVYDPTTFYIGRALGFFSVQVAN